MKTKITYILIILLVISNIVFYFRLESVKSERLYERAIPHIELTAAMVFYGVDVYRGEVLSSPNSGDIAVGSIAGFVQFENLADQPKDLRQYYTIESSDSYDENGNQLFTLKETLKFNAIPPRSLEAESLKVVSNSPQAVTLETEYGQSFRIDKRTDLITLIDQQGDISTLITSESDYQDFMLEFLD